jgi:hypothetical protein
LFEELIRRIPPELLHASGKAFHSGRRAFSGSRDLYILGFNPGGDPQDRTETVATNIEQVRHEAEDWCAFLDQDWRPGGRYYGRGKAPLQLEMQDLATCLGLDLRGIPVSDVIFARSRQAHHMDNPRKLMDLCWPFHQAVIEGPRIRVVLCLYKGAAEFVREKTGARVQPVDRACARSRAGREYWRETFEAPSGLKIVQITRPTGISWTQNACALTKRALAD